MEVASTARVEEGEGETTEEHRTAGTQRGAFTGVLFFFGILFWFNVLSLLGEYAPEA